MKENLRLKPARLNIFNEKKSSEGTTFRFLVPESFSSAGGSLLIY